MSKHLSTIKAAAILAVSTLCIVPLACGLYMVLVMGASPREIMGLLFSKFILFSCAIIIMLGCGFIVLFNFLNASCAAQKSADDKGQRPC